MGKSGRKYVYTFAEGDASMRNLLGGKGSGVCEMTKLGMPVPEGFVITTEACARYFADGETISDDIRSQIMENLSELENRTGKKFGSTENPLLVSVRSGARTSMPGMMDTVLNLGLNEDVVQGLISKVGNSRWVWDTYRRFIQMYADVVTGIDESLFEHYLDEYKQKRDMNSDIDLDAADFEQIASAFLKIYKEQVGEDFPTQPDIQLIEAVKAVFRSWNNKRAVYFRSMNHIPSNWGTAVTIQRMVFGNLSEKSGTGVAFSRNPATGSKGLFGEYLMNAQGEDVVSGVRTPVSIDHLQEQNPRLYQEFSQIVAKLELHYRDMQDMEFTIEEGRLFMLQTRNGKRTPQAAFAIASDFVDEGILTQEQAVQSIDPQQVTELLHPRFDQDALAKATVLGVGLPASPGAASGRVVFSADDAAAWAAKGEQVILVRLDTTPEDIIGMHRAQGLLTARGGMTSHAAVVARGIGRCCIAGLSEIEFNDQGVGCTIKGVPVNEGDWISLDGDTGTVYLGRIQTVPAKISGAFKRVLSWADRIRHLKVFANAETVEDARQALDFGAEGIGLCRTEHMFFRPDRIDAIRRLIIAPDTIRRQMALEELLPMQRADFEELYEAMQGMPVTVRLLDPPLHEFLPKKEGDIAQLAEQNGIEIGSLKDIIESLREVNPMMGHRGCRLSISYPEITQMQTQAVIEAAIAVKRRHPMWSVAPEIMVPLVSEAKELEYVKSVITQTADEVIAASGMTMYYYVGTMVETPRAALTADELAADAEFFSFGTNDLTQMTFGFSRDDSSTFTKTYFERGILDDDPFACLDEKGVGKLITLAADLGRRTRPDLRIGVCGEHGGDTRSIGFCERIGLDYVSCSPFRVPGARLAAAQATLAHRRPEEDRRLPTL